MDGFGDFNQIKPKDPDNTPLSFGKHKGRTPRELRQNDYDYLVWAWENVGPHVCSRDLYEQAKDAVRENDESDWLDRDGPE